MFQRVWNWNNRISCCWFLFLFECLSFFLSLFEDSYLVGIICLIFVIGQKLFDQCFSQSEHDWSLLCSPQLYLYSTKMIDCLFHQVSFYEKHNDSFSIVYFHSYSLQQSPYPSQSPILLFNPILIKRTGTLWKERIILKIPFFLHETQK